MKEARYFDALDGPVRCRLCPQGCTIEEGDGGRCGVRVNRQGRLYALTYGRVTSLAVDPMEKKPLYHFLPGAPVLSIGQNGCNLNCRFCQNWSISLGGSPEQALDPAGVVKAAREQGCRAVAYTYNEPLVGFEFVLDCARAAHDAGLANVAVTNGYINPAPLAELLPFLDALNVDLKSMDDSFYHRLCGGAVGPVLNTLKTVAHQAHLEITNLVIPGENDSDQDLRTMADWIADHLGQDQPVHLSAYHRAHEMTASPTPLKTMERAHSLFRHRLRHVYLGNVRTTIGRDTRCECGAVLVARTGYEVRKDGLTAEGLCVACGAETPLITCIERTSPS